MLERIHRSSTNLCPAAEIKKKTPPGAQGIAFAVGISEHRHRNCGVLKILGNIQNSGRAAPGIGPGDLRPEPPVILGQFLPPSQPLPESPGRPPPPRATPWHRLSRRWSGADAVCGERRRERARGRLQLAPAGRQRRHGDIPEPSAARSRGMPARNRPRAAVVRGNPGCARSQRMAGPCFGIGPKRDANPPCSSPSMADIP